MKKLSILGSTGSIGTQTLDIIEKNPNEFRVVGLTVNSNIDLLKKQINEFKPEAVAVMDKEKADELKQNSDINVYSGIDGIIKIAILDESDTVVNSLVGSVGIKPTIESIKNKKTQEIINNKIKKTKNDIIIDSHLSHYLPRKYVDLCIVTKCDIKVLKNRLKNKKYSKSKVRENLDAEIFDICLNH